MKRDMDLVRRILQTVEAHGTAFNFKALRIEGFEREVVAYHVGLLHEAGYLDAKEITMPAAPSRDWAPRTLTWKGHDFLKAVGEDTVWQKVKDRLVKVGGDAPVEVVKALGVQVMKDLLGLGAP